MNNLDKLQGMSEIYEKDFSLDDSQKKSEKKQKERTQEEFEINEDQMYKPFISPNINSTKIEKPFKLGICGGNSAGKALLTEKISTGLQKHGLKIKIVKQDHFEIDADEVNDNLLNKKIPYVNETQWENFKSIALDALKDKSYDVAIIEGSLIFYDQNIRDKCDLRVFLDNDQDVRLSRKIYKEVCVKKKTDINTFIKTYLQKSKPLFEKYIKPSKRFADVIIPQFGGGFKLSEQGISEEGFEKKDHVFIEFLIKLIRAGQI